MNRTRMLLIATALGLAACGDDSCDRYVDYMCDCHPESDCEDLRKVYEDADGDLQDECAAELDDQKDEDDGECGTGGEDSAAG